jgi:hypothetical protein
LPGPKPPQTLFPAFSPRLEPMLAASIAF